MSPTYLWGGRLYLDTTHFAALLLDSGSYSSLSVVSKEEASLVVSEQTCELKDVCSPSSVSPESQQEGKLASRL